MKRKTLIAVQIVLLVIVTAVAFAPSVRNGFTNWDDPELILKNDTVKGLTGPNLRAIFTNSYAGFGGYTPLVLLSYAVEHEFFGLDPKVFHVDNLVLHVLNTLLIYALIALIFKDLWVAFAAALLFGVHPLHVEAVAWIQGRKDLLFSFFYLAAAIAYQVFLRRPKRPAAWFVLSLALFGGALFSKVAAISFPLIVLLLESHERRTLDKRTLRRLAPFLGLAAAFLVLAFLTMRTSAYGIPAPKVPLTYAQNLWIFFYAFIFYVSKIFLPIRLSARYPSDIAGYPMDLLLNGAVFALACAFLCFAYRRQRETVRFGVGFFIFTLLPTLPFHFAGQPYADRYTYLPLAFLLTIIPAVFFNVRPVAARLRRAQIAGAGVLTALVVLYFGVLTWSYSRVWHDSISLWTRVLKIDPRSSLALRNRGSAFSEEGNMESALADFDAGLKVDPKNPVFAINRGAVYFKKGEYEKAMQDFNYSLALDPNSEMAYINRAILWGRLLQFEKTVQDCTRAIAINPYSYRAYYYRGTAYKALGAFQPALADFEAANRIFPSEATRREIEGLTGRKRP